MLKPGGLFCASVGCEEKWVPDMVHWVLTTLSKIRNLGSKRNIRKITPKQDAHRLFYKWVFQHREWENLVRSAGFEILRVEPGYKRLTFYRFPFFHPRSVSHKDIDFRMSEPDFTPVGAVVFKTLKTLFPWGSCNWAVCVARKPLDSSKINSNADIDKNATPHDELLHILACPESGQSLQLGNPELLERLNVLIDSGELLNQEGRPVIERLDQGLIREDGQLLYPIRKKVPVLLMGEAITLTPELRSDGRNTG